MYPQNVNIMKTLCHLGDIQYFTKTRKKAKTESLRGLRPRKKVSYVKLDIDQRTQKVILKCIANFLELVPNRWNELKLDNYLSIGTLIWENRKLIQTRPCVCPNTGSNYDMQYQLLQKNSYKARSCSFCGSKLEGFFVLPNHRKICLAAYSWVKTTCVFRRLEGTTRKFTHFPYKMHSFYDKIIIELTSKEY